MNPRLEARLIANSALLHGLIGCLVEKRIISPSDVSAIAGDAQEWLAAQAPEIMSVEGRKLAADLLAAMPRY
jgi:hypothetical protein